VAEGVRSACPPRTGNPEDRMSTWEFVVDTLEWLAMVPLLLLLWWASIERARIRHQWLKLQMKLSEKGAPYDWCVAASVLAGGL
jgi:hypothetical protein